MDSTCKSLDMYAASVGGAGGGMEALVARGVDEAAASCAGVDAGADVRADVGADASGLMQLQGLMQDQMQEQIQKQMQVHVHFPQYHCHLHTVKMLPSTPSQHTSLPRAHNVSSHQTGDPPHQQPQHRQVALSACRNHMHER